MESCLKPIGLFESALMYLHAFLLSKSCKPLAFCQPEPQPPPHPLPRRPSRMRMCARTHRSMCPNGASILFTYTVGVSMPGSRTAEPYATSTLTILSLDHEPCALQDLRSPTRCPLPWKCGVLASGPPKNSLSSF